MLNQVFPNMEDEEEEEEEKPEEDDKEKSDQKQEETQANAQDKLLEEPVDQNTAKDKKNKKKTN